MDFEALFAILPKKSIHWNPKEVLIWLKFISLPTVNL